MYNSTDREFIQKDPKAGSITEPMTQNGYTYCGDNPLYYIDPDGCSYISTLGNAGRTAFDVVKSGVAGGLGFYTRICCEIDNMPTWAKAAVGTTGIVVAGVSGVGAAAIAEAVIASAGISAVTDGAFYTVASLRNGSFSRSELKDTVINGAVNGYMFGGAGLGVAGIRNTAKSGKLAGFMADEAGSVSYEGGTDFQVSYSRPSGFRKGVRDKVWDNAKNANGDVIDPVTKRVMDKSEPWDMGHKPGYEFRKHQQSAENRGISRKQFLDEYNNTEHYRPELPSSNRSHKGEDITNNYFGDW